jgi:DNA-directed RNA polymerase I, II, and III subunit RPABC2
MAESNPALEILPSSSSDEELSTSGPSTDTESDGESVDNEIEYLQKLDEDFKRNYLLDFHPETLIHNFDEIFAMSTITRDDKGKIIDELHRTLPFLTKYERARILGVRAKQINSGADSFVSVPDDIIDGYSIAVLEYDDRKIPFIIRRPLPNGGSEYWKFADLEQISY